MGDKSLEKGLAQFFKKSLKKIYKGSKKTHTQKNRYSCEILKKKKVMKNFKDHLEIKNYLQNQKSKKISYPYFRDPYFFFFFFSKNAKGQIKDVSN